MKTWLLLRTPLAILGVTALALLVIAALVQTGVTQFIVPTPEITGEEFVRAFDAHRFEGAANELSQDIDPDKVQQEMSEIFQQVESAHQGIKSVNGQGDTETKPTATARIQVSLEDGTEKVLDFPEDLENGIWRITSIEPLKQLAQ